MPPMKPAYELGYLGILWDSRGYWIAYKGDGTIQTSPDGKTWTSRTSNLTVIYTILQNGTRYLAHAFYAQDVATSNDGITWTVGVTGIGEFAGAMTYSTDKFLVYGTPLGKGSPQLSYFDGSWTAQTNTHDFGIIPKGFVTSQGIFLVYGNSYGIKKSTTITNKQFNFVDLDTPDWLSGQEQWVSIDDKIFALIQGGSIATTSNNGTTWTSSSTSILSVSGIVKGGNCWVAYGGTQVVISAGTGTTFNWKPLTDSPFTATILSMAWNGTQFLGVTDAEIVSGSANGSVWTLATGTFPAQEGLPVIAYGDKWLVTSMSTGSTRPSIVSSTDGLSFQEVPTPYTDGALGLLYNGTKWLTYDATTLVVLPWTTTDPFDEYNNIYYQNSYWLTYASDSVAISTDGINWAPQSWQLSYVGNLIWNQGYWLGFGQDSAGVGLIVKSTNGQEWTVSDNEIMNYINDAVYNGTYWIAYGTKDGHSSTFTFAYSTNGTTWVEQTGPTTRRFITKLIYNETSRTWLGVAIEGLVTGVKPDTVQGGAGYLTWTNRDSPSGLTIEGVIIKDNKFLAYGFNGTDKSMSISPDGITWSTLTGPSTNIVKIYTNGSVYIAAADGGPIYVCQAGSDTWTLKYTLAQTVENIVWNNSYWIAISPNKIVKVSADGATWTKTTTNPLSTGLLRRNVYWSGSYWVAISGGATPFIVKSAKGLVWTALTTDLTGGLTNIAYNGTYWVGSTASKGSSVIGKIVIESPIANPSNLQIINKTGVSFTVTFSSSADSQDYWISTSVLPNPTTTVKTGSTTATHIDFTGLQKNTRYYVVIKSVYDNFSSVGAYIDTTTLNPVTKNFFLIPAQGTYPPPKPRPLYLNYVIGSTATLTMSVEKSSLLANYSSLQLRLQDITNNAVLKIKNKTYPFTLNTTTYSRTISLFPVAANNKLVLGLIRLEGKRNNKWYVIGYLKKMKYTVV